MAYYRFDDGVATDDLDTAVATNLGSLGSAGNGSYNGIYTRGVPGVVAGDTAILFSQLTPTAIDYRGSMNVPNNAALNPSHTAENPFSLECWVKPTTNTSTLLSPVNSMSFTTGRAGYLIYQNGATWQLRLGNKASTTYVINGGTVTAGAWQHLVATYTGGANGTMKLYVNGVSVGSLAITGVGYEANDNAAFVVGGTNAPNRTFDGVVDEVAFYPSVLDAARIADRFAVQSSNPAGYTAHVLADSPVGYWRLGETAFIPRTPPVAANAATSGAGLGAAANGSYYAGSKNTATGPNTAGQYAGFGASNSALALQTANGHVGTALGLLNNRSAFTVTGWIKRGATKSTRGGYFGQNDLLEFGDAGSGTQIEAWVNAAGGNVIQTYPMADDVWGFIAMTGDATTCRLTIHYYDPADSTHKVISGTRAGVANFGTSAFNFNIGGGGIFTTSGDYFRGEIDEVAVFDKALSPGRIQQLYDTAVGTVPPTAGVPTVSPGTVIPEGQSYSLSVDPAGTPPFTYQWKAGGVDIPGATGKTYTVSNAVPQSPVTAPFSYTVTITNASGSYTTDPAVDVYVAPGLVWKGNDGTNPTFWDISTTANWVPISGGGAVQYTDDYSVKFDDSATATTVDVQADVTPQGVIFANPTKTYTLTGAAGIVGPDGLTKSGAGVVQLFNSNAYTGPTVVNAGTLRIGDGTTGEIASGSAVAVNGGVLELNPVPAGLFPNSTAIAAGGQLAIKGTGAMSLSGTNSVTGGGSELFDRAGVVTVNRPNGISTVVINTGEVVFNGPDHCNNRLGNMAAVTVKSGAMMTIRGINVLPGGTNAFNPTVEQGATLKVVTHAGSHLHVNNITLKGGSLILDNEGGGNGYSNESFQCAANLLVTGSNASTIAFGTGGNNANSGFAIKGNSTFNVEDVTGSAAADLLVAAEIENPDSGTNTLTKSGAGTMLLQGGLAHSFSGVTTVSDGTLAGTGSWAGPLTVNPGAAVAPGEPVGTLTVAGLTLGGSYRCDISGAQCDKLQVNGNVTLGAAAAINITASAPTAPVYQLVSYTGTLSGNTTPTVSGIPAGYSLVIGFNSILIAQDGLSFSPTIAPSSPGAGAALLGGSTFDSDNGGMTVSPAVSAETDWTYTAGSWRSNGQAADNGQGSNLTYLTAPQVTITKAGAVMLVLSHRYSFEPSWDGGLVEVSINGGAFQTVPASAFQENGYSGTVRADSSITLAGSAAFVANSPGHPAFITSVCKLAAANPGDTIQVRFKAEYDANTSGSGTPPGWDITSYQVIEGSVGFTITWPFGILQYSSNLQPPWTDLTGATSPYEVYTTLAPSRFFRVKP